MDKSQFKLSRVSGAPVEDSELIADLKRVAGIVGHNKVTQKLYSQHGQYDRRTIDRRFGTWNDALIAAGLSVSNRINISDEELYENILNLWQHYGRQPRRAELSRPPSSISQGAYRRRFKSWMDALRSFIAYANASDVAVKSGKNSSSSFSNRRTGREPSLRLRFKVLLRDNFSCVQCGASPAKRLGVELHVDHIVPWSRSGETTLDNLQTLCSKCNLGKSNLNPK